MTQSAKQRPKVFLLFAALGILVVGVFVWRQFAGWPIANRLPSSDVIVMLGDSLTAGAGAAPGRTWPELIGKRLGKTVLSAGISGDTTAGGLARIQRDVLSNNPGVIIVCLGGNDILRRIPTEQTVSNIDQILSQSKESGALVLFAGVQALPFFSGLGSQYRDLCKKHGAIYVPNILGGIITDRKLMADQIHPNSEGYEIMADRVVEALRPHMLP